MSEVTINGVEVYIYKVGIYRDFDKLKNQGFKIFWYWFKTSWRRKSYWNGYLAESDNKHKAGKGWTEKQALRNWYKIKTEVER